MEPSRTRADDRSYLRLLCIIIMAGFPNVICAVDGTLIAIRKPWHNAKDYMTRRRPKPLLNVMVNIYLSNTPTQS